MAYASGNIVLDDHFNTFVTGSASGTPNHAVKNINSMWGVGQGDKGYGQNSTIPYVSAGNTVTAAEWASFFSRMNSISAHTGQAITSPTLPTSGDIITAINTIDTDLTNLWNSRLNHASNGTSVTSNRSGTATWTVRSVIVWTFSFSTADEVRYWWNAGGLVDIGSSRTGGSGYPKNLEWTDLCTQMGTIRMSAQTAQKIGGSGTATINPIGYYDLTTVNQTIFQQYADSSPYSSNYIRLEARTNGTQGSNGDNGTVLTFTLTFEDAAPDDSGVPDYVDGTLTGAWTRYPPSTANLTASWGTQTVTSTITQT